MSVFNPPPLDDALAGLKSVIVALPAKTQALLAVWLVDWSRYLAREAAFMPAMMPKFNRGDIIYVNFGFNIGHEFGGVHYAVVIENNNSKSSGTVLVVPLASLHGGKAAANVSSGDLYLGPGVIPWKQAQTLAKISQTRAISKMRILKPLGPTDKQARLSPVHLSMIDERLMNLAVKPNLDNGEVRP